MQIIAKYKYRNEASSNGTDNIPSESSVDAKIVDIGIQAQNNGASESILDDDSIDNEIIKSTKLSYLNDNFCILFALFV